jgi:hypothetical protein
MSVFRCTSRGVPPGRRALTLVAVVALLAAAHGCTRNFYRRSADKEVNDILVEKDVYPQWKIEQYHVYPDPRARFADTGCPDRPATPPDDEAAYKLAPHPQQPGCAGVGTTEGTAWLEIMKIWDEQNREARSRDAAAEDEAAKQAGHVQTLFDAPPIQEQKNGFLIKLDQAVELGLINSREYQSFREDLYESALPVTSERFSFAFQWAVIENAFRQWAGPFSSVGQQNNWTLNTNTGFTKFFSTGALLTLAFANKTVFDFTHAGNLSTSSSINLDFIQPLLRGGGKAVALENLTQAERNLLYDIRGYGHFREDFYGSIALGTTLPSNLAAVSGIGGGGGSPISVLASLGIASTDVSGSFRGYLPSLFRELDMAVDRKYVKDLEKALVLFEGFQEGGQVSPLQVAQVNSTLLQARNAVLKDIQDTTNAIDQLKLQLGVPANLPLVLDDAPARDITAQLDRYYQILDDSDSTFKQVEQQENLPPEKLRAFLQGVFANSRLTRGTDFAKKSPAAWQAWAKADDKTLDSRLKELGKQRRDLLDRKTELEMKNQTLSPEEARTLRQTEFDLDVGALEDVVRAYERLPKNVKAGDRLKRFRLIAYSAEVVLVWGRNERFDKIGQSWPTLPGAPLEDVDLLTADVDQGQMKAVQAALAGRWDLMNARAQVVDAWRQVAVTANALMGVFNVQYHLDSQTRPGGLNPFGFAADRTNQQLILNATLPLVRVNERNNYRIALINFQRARRNLMSAEDTIAAQVRFDVRQLHLFAENFKIQQKVLESLYSQVENALEVIVAPVDPDQLKATGTAGQANAAALTNQYLGALGSLNGAQTQMYRIWLSYLATRMQLYIDLERLPLDNRGVWIDERGASGDPSCAGTGTGAPHVERGNPDPQPAERPRLLPPPEGRPALE